MNDLLPFQYYWRVIEQEKVIVLCNDPHHGETLVDVYVGEKAINNAIGFCLGGNEALFPELGDETAWTT